MESTDGIDGIDRIARIVRRRRRGSWLAGALGLVIAASADAGLHKCALDEGRVTYQEDPCAPGKELRDFDKDPANVSVVPFRIVPGPDTRLAAPSERASGKPARKSRTTPDRRGNAAERKFLAPGISEGEVVARIGRPDMSSGGNGRKVMRWTYMPVPEDPGTLTTLTFEFGRLVEVERKLVRTP